MASTSCKKEKQSIIGQSISTKRLVKITDLSTYFTVHTFEYDKHGYIIRYTRNLPNWESKYIQVPKEVLEISYERDENHKVLVEHYNNAYRGSQAKKTGIYKYNSNNELVRVDYTYENIYTPKEYLEYVREHSKVTYIIGGRPSDGYIDTITKINYDGLGNVTSMNKYFPISPGEKSPIHYYTYDNKPNNTPTIKGLDNFYPIYGTDAQLLSQNNVLTETVHNNTQVYALEYNNLGLLVNSTSEYSNKNYSYGNYIYGLELQ